MSGHDVATGDHQLGTLALFENGRRGVGIGRLLNRRRRTLHAPQGLARLGVEAKDVGRIFGAHAVQYLHVE